MINYNDKEILKYLEKAKKVATTAYAPYSNFRVGALLISSTGKEYTGINIENQAYPSGMCAERTALFKAVSEGEKKFKGVFIFSPDSEKILPPCGSCRQSLSEFADNEFFFVLSDKKMNYKKFEFDEILPMSTSNALNKLKK